MSQKVFKVIIFSIAFAFVEAAVVVYLRHLLSSTVVISKEEILFLTPGIAFLEPDAAVKIIANTKILNVERIREASTLFMIASVALLAAENFKKWIAFFFLIFGIWDIFYYVFLRLTISWPTSLNSFDVFFLLPTPWIGPVLVPVSISVVFIFLSLFYLVKSSSAKFKFK